MLNYDYSTKNAIIQFCKKNNFVIDKNVLDTFMDEYTSRSYFKLTYDTFLLTCSFLELYDAISLTQVNKNYIVFYNKLWANSNHYKMCFPFSTILNKEYELIKKNLQLEIYYYHMKNTYETFNSDEAFQKIHKDEKMIQKRLNDIKKTNNDIQIRTHKAEIKAYEKCIHGNIDYLPRNFYKFLESFICISQTYDNKPFLTIKKPIDMRLYGLSPNKDKKYWEKTGIHWATYEYNYEASNCHRDHHIFDADSFDYYDSDDVLIANEESINSRYYYKVRKPPIWDSIDQ